MSIEANNQAAIQAQLLAQLNAAEVVSSPGSDPAADITAFLSAQADVASAMKQCDSDMATFGAVQPATELRMAKACEALNTTLATLNSESSNTMVSQFLDKNVQGIDSISASTFGGETLAQIGADFATSPATGETDVNNFFQGTTGSESGPLYASFEQTFDSIAK